MFGIIFVTIIVFYKFYQYLYLYLNCYIVVLVTSSSHHLPVFCDNNIF